MFASRPLRSTVVTRFPATMGRSDSRTAPPQGYEFPSDVGRLRPHRRVSQVPRLICPHAPSPTTPESPMTARTHCFIIGGRLHLVVQLGRSHFSNEAESVRLRYGSRVRLRQASAGELLHRPLARLPVEWVITGQAPFSLQDQPGFSWHTRHKTRCRRHASGRFAAQEISGATYSLGFECR